MRMIAAVVLSIVLLGSVAPVQAEEDWRTHAIGRGGPTIRLPEAWTVLVDELEGGLKARSHDAPVVRLAASATATAAEASLEDIRDDVVQALFDGPGVDATIEDEAERTVGARPALWTLLAYEGASGPRRSLLVVASGVTARFDLDADAFPTRRALLVEIIDTLERSVPDDPDLVAAPGLEREALDLLRAFMTHVPRTRAELDELAKALGREADVDDALAALDELIAAAGTGGEEVLTLVGWRRFHHPLPEALHYRGHEFLRTVEKANAQRWFGPDERAAYAEAGRAWERAKQHIGQLESDHRYRAADQMLANLAHDPAFESQTLVALSAPPYVLVHVGPGRREDVAARLGREGETLEAVYQTLLAGYGDALGLADLTAPYGGRPDLPVTYRSFPDGVVLVALVPATEAIAEALDTEGARGLRGVGGLPALSSARTERLLLAPEENLGATAVMGAKQLLLTFTRQRNRWGASRRAFAAFVDGFARQFAAVEQDGDGQTSFPWDAAPHLASMRALARALAPQGRAYPLLPLRQLIAFGSVVEAERAMDRLAPFRGMPPGLRVRTLFDQSWALATFLMEAENGRWRDAYLGAVRAGLDRQIGVGGLNEVAFARAFGLIASPTDEGWKELESAWTRFVREELLQGIGPASPPPTKEPTPEEPHEN